MGPSGAGKSSLVFGTLLPALMGRAGGSFASLDGAAAGTVHALDARPIGRTSRSTPATFSGVFDLVRARFAATEAAKKLGLSASRFSYNNKDGRCVACEGLGVLKVGLHLLADAEVVCGVCHGQRYAPATLAVALRGKSIADVLALSVAEAFAFFSDDPPVASLLGAMDQLGLGYLSLGQPSASLSRGEAQRVRLATLLGKGGAQRADAGAQPPGPQSVAPRTLLLLDEPDRGLHPADIERLLGALTALTDAGHTVLAISHHRHVWAAADYVTRVDAGVASEIQIECLERLSRTRGCRPVVPPPTAIELSGVQTHSLRALDVAIPHDQITVITGVSGSGKSSLAFHTLVSEAWHRFSESLPFAVRRFVRRAPRPALASAVGLRPTLALRQGQARAPRRSTVATQSELSPLLRVLWSRAGQRNGEPCELSAEHFSPDRPLGACPACEGLGELARCSPALLVTDPSRAVADGALAGTRPGRFFSEPDGQHMATPAAALRDAGMAEAMARPWSELSESARAFVLDGAGERRVSVHWAFKRGKREGEHVFEGTWDGLCVLVEREARRRANSKQAEAWAAPLLDSPCAACGGTRLAPEVAAVTVGEHTLPELLARPLMEVSSLLAVAQAAITDPRRSVVLREVLPPIVERVDDLCGLGLGHLSLARRSQTLSEGELGRTRLAGVVRSGLTGTTIVLDEPGAGLHPHEVGVVIERLRGLRDQGNTVVVVAHRPELIVAADHMIEMGPGAGPNGGQIVAQGSVADVLAGDCLTARALRVTPRPRDTDADGPRCAASQIVVRGAHRHNLQSIDIALPSRGFVAVTGVSGSGKSSLVFDVIEASARHGKPVGCASVAGLDRFVEVRSARVLGQGA
ncbi:MAG: hypothetical protein JKY37_13555, partial [Nannocystaceae bacterium]|nr:hypothetical protein [Nannocystaceae bacterium]